MTNGKPNSFAIKEGMGRPAQTTLGMIHAWIYALRGPSRCICNFSGGLDRNPSRYPKYGLIGSEHGPNLKQAFRESARPDRSMHSPAKQRKAVNIDLNKAQLCDKAPKKGSSDNFHLKSEVNHIHSQACEGPGAKTAGWSRSGPRAPRRLYVDHFLSRTQPRLHDFTTIKVTSQVVV